MTSSTVTNATWSHEGDQLIRDAFAALCRDGRFRSNHALTEFLELLVGATLQDWKAGLPQRQWTTEDLAAAWRTTPGNVRVRANKLRERLREYNGQEGKSEPIYFEVPLRERGEPLSLVVIRRSSSGSTAIVRQPLRDGSATESVSGQEDGKPVVAQSVPKQSTFRIQPASAIPASGRLISFKAWCRQRGFQDDDHGLVMTENVNRVIDTILGKAPRGKPWQVLLRGAIAAGKSTAAYQVLHRALLQKQFSTVWVLPLGLDYPGIDGSWSREKAMSALAASLASIPKLARASTLILIEDAHEGVRLSQAPWIYPEENTEAASLLREFSLLVTSRYGAATATIEKKEHNRLDVTSGFERNCQVRLRIFDLDVKHTANEIVRRAVSDDHGLADQASRLFRHTGQSLVALRTALDTWIDRKRKGPIAMHLVQEAVTAELDKVAAGLSGDSTTEAVRCLALVWMVGGLDTLIDVDHIRSYFRLERHEQRYWRQLVNAREINVRDSIYTPPRRYACLRHPAWGQLVLYSMDEGYMHPSRFSGIPTDLVRSFLESRFGVVYRDILTSGKHGPLKPSVCLILSLMHAKPAGEERESFLAELEFYCAGRMMFDEFVTASMLLLDIDRQDGGSAQELATRQMHIASVARRATPMPWDVTQYRINLASARASFHAALDTQRDIFGPELAEFPQLGYAYYEDSYYDLRFGHLEEAARKAQRSIDIEATAGNDRLMFRAMSRSQLAKVYVRQGRYPLAIETAEQALEELRQSEVKSEETHTRINRFRGNVVHVLGEAYLNLADIEQANRHFKEFREQYGKANMVMGMELTYARLALASGNARGAQSNIQGFRSDLINVRDGEMWEECYRITGDAYALLDDAISAVVNYKQVIPEDTQELGHEARVAQERIRRIESGLTGADVLKGAYL